MTIKFNPKHQVWKIRDLDCLWCGGRGIVSDPEDPSFEIDCLCVTHTYPADTRQPKLKGLEDSATKKCPECGNFGYAHKISCDYAWRMSIGGYSSGY